MLEYDETLKLLKQAKQGDENAKNLLIENNSPLVKSIVKRYKNKGVEYEDLYQLGCVGFAKAINNFDESFNVKFSTYAVPMIAGEIKRFLRDDGSVKVSRSIKTKYYQIQKYFDECKSQNKEKPTIAELTKIFKIDEQELMFVLESARMPVSIYDSLDKETTSGQTILDKLSKGDNTDDRLNKMMLLDMIKALDNKDKRLILLRFYRDKTQSEVAKILGVSQVQVSRLENKILKKMKNRLEG